ncbi:MAG TPA: cellulase family glycosylhydrolase [Arachidicoccus soli]|nr:cellulase family glycosylhydrolase [Arachidicoccus soli]
MKKELLLIPFLVVIILLIVSCKKAGITNDESKIPTPSLIVSADSLKFSMNGGDDTLHITMNGGRWAAASDQSWCTLSNNSSTSASSKITVTLSANQNMGNRSAKLTFVMDAKTIVYVVVSQLGRTSIYPSYGDSIPPDASGMSSTAVQLAAKFKLGWNIGNSMEATGGETSWGNPLITESYIQFVKQLGFTAIRIPCAWDSHVDNPATAHIDTSWLNRVKQVVGYCVNNGMYVLLNIHWDGGWLENNCTLTKKDSVNAKQKAFWEQIATEMRDFDEHLMFASANEPNTNNDSTQMAVLMSYHQTFVNAVRSTGGRNTYRTLVIQGDYQLINLNGFPSDPTPNRIMYEDHNYTPFQFTTLNGDATWGKMFYYWGAGHHSTIEPDRNATWGEESYQLQYFDLIKSKFIDKGIPVLMGEYGAYRRGGTANVPLDLPTHNASVDYWITYMTQQALAHGLKPFFWDTGSILDRKNNTVIDQETINAIMAGAK